MRDEVKITSRSSVANEDKSTFMGLGKKTHGGKEITELELNLCNVKKMKIRTIQFHMPRSTRKGREEGNSNGEVMPVSERK